MRKEHHINLRSATFETKQDLVTAPSCRDLWERSGRKKKQNVTVPSNDHTNDGGDCEIKFSLVLLLKFRIPHIC